MIFRAIPCLALCLSLAGCISTPLGERDWVRIRTPHYDVWSALSVDDSLHLAVDLERFRASTAFISGRALAKEAVVTRVFAFDDRGVGRPFAYQSRRSYLLPRQPGDVIVLRTGGGWEGDAWIELKLEYARRLLWNASAEAMPPWLDEGLPQLASTLESRTDGAVAGVLRPDHVDTLRDSQWIPFDRLLGTADFTGWSGTEREVFAAEAWALCHYLTFNSEAQGIRDGALSRYRARIDEGSELVAAARSEFGEPGKLQREVSRAIYELHHPEGRLRIKWVGSAPQPRSVPRQEALEQLGALALAIGKQDLAEEFLGDAQKLGTGSAHSHATWGDLREARGDREGADERYRAALAAAPDDAQIHLRYANLLRARAMQRSEHSLREQSARLARSHYARSIELDGSLAESHAGLAETHFVDGEDPADALAHAKAARKLLPGDAEIGLLSARLELALGDRAAARRGAAHVLTRARSAPELEAVRSFLAQIDERAAIR